MKIPYVSVLPVIGKISLFLNLLVNSDATDQNLTSLSSQPKAGLLDINPKATDEYNDDDYYEYDEAKYGVPDEFPKKTNYLLERNILVQNENENALPNMANVKKILNNFQGIEQDKTKKLKVKNSSGPVTKMAVKRRNPHDDMNTVQRGQSYNKLNNERAHFASLIPLNPIPENQNDKYGAYKGNSNDYRTPHFYDDYLDDYQRVERNKVARYNPSNQQHVNQYNMVGNTQPNPSDNMKPNHEVYPKLYNSGKVRQPQMFLKPKPNYAQIPPTTKINIDLLAIKPFPEQMNNIVYIRNDQPFSMVNGKIGGVPLSYSQVKREAIHDINSGKVHSGGAIIARNDFQKPIQRMPNAPNPSQQKQNYQMPQNLVSQMPRQQYFESPNQGRPNIAPMDASSQMLKLQNPAQNQVKIARNQNTQNLQQNQPTWNQMYQNQNEQQQYPALQNSYPNQVLRNQIRQDQTNLNQTVQNQIEQNPDPQDLKQQQPLNHLFTDLTTVQPNKPTATIDYDAIRGWNDMEFPSLTTVLSESSFLPLSPDVPSYYAGVAERTQDDVVPIEIQAMRELLLTQAKNMIVEYHVGFLTAFGYKLLEVLESKHPADLYELITGFRLVTDRMITEGKLRDMGEPTIMAIKLTTSYCLSWAPRKMKGELSSYATKIVTKRGLSQDYIDIINILDAAYTMAEGEALLLTLIDVDGFNGRNNYTTVEISEIVLDALLKPYWRILNTPKQNELFGIINNVLIKNQNLLLMVHRRQQGSQFDESLHKKYYEEISRVTNKNRRAQLTFNGDQAFNINKTQLLVESKNNIKRQINHLKHTRNVQHNIEIDKRFYNKRKEDFKSNSVPSYHNNTFIFDAKKIKTDAYFVNIHKDESRNITKNNNIRMVNVTPGEYIFLKPILDNQKLDYYKRYLTSYNQKNERTPFSATKKFKDRLQEGFNYEKTLINKNKYDAKEKNALNYSKNENSYVTAFANTKKAYKLNQKRFQIVNSSQTIVNESKNDILETTLSIKKEIPAQYVAKISMKHTPKSKYLEPAQRTRQSYRKAIDYTKDTDSKRYTNNTNIIEESDYSDEEKQLKIVLSDVIRHSDFVMHNARRNDAVIKRKNTIDGTSSYSDDEWQIKNNIYKAFGYDPELDAKNKV